MAQDRDRELILIVGDEHSTARAGLVGVDGVSVEVVGSLAEAEERQASQHYTRIIIDPAVFGDMIVEVLGRTISEQQALELSALMDTVPAMVFISHDSEGRKMTGNKATHVFLRVPESANVSRFSIEGRPYRNFTAVKDGVELANEDLPVQRASRGEEIRDYELDMVFEDGEIRTIYGNATPIYDDGRPIGAVGAFVDITERKRAEERLRESREDLNRAQAVARTGSWRLNVNRNELLWSDETYRMFGIPQGTPLTYEIFLSAVYPDDKEYVDREWTAALSSGHYDIEHRIVVGGDVKWVHERAELEFDEEGQLLGGFGTVQDITEQKQLEQQQKQLLDREHHIAQILQQAILPSELLERIGNYRVVAKYQPAFKEAEIGGDFYDIFQMDESRYGILIGDVAGKGLDAAIRVAGARHTIRSYAMLDPRPGRVMTLANEALVKAESDIDNLMTAFFAVLDTGSGVLSYSSAGHEPPVVCGGDNDILQLYASGIPLGIVIDAKYAEGSLRLSPGQRIVMVTDGIIEARNAENDLFAQEGLIDCVRRHCGKDAEEFASHLMEEANEFAGGHTQDDAAIVVVDVE